MYIILPAVLSADGKMSKGNNHDAHTWASAEDGAQFAKLIAANNLLVMGRKTYQNASRGIDAQHLRVVLTSRPENFAAKVVPGQLEFVSARPQELVQQLTARGFETMLLLGGRSLHHEFLLAGLVNELRLTLEPALFGQGLNLLPDSLLDVPMELLGVEQLNKRGTLLLRYKVLPRA